MNPQLSPKAIREIREGTCNPLGAPQVTTDLSENIILTSLDDLHNWARLSSLWPLLYGTACCFIEFAALIGSRFDFDRFGLVPRSSPRQADLLIVAPKGRTGERKLTYESGMEPIGGAWIQFNIRYYMFALVFVIFDVETVFLYPWAVAFNRLGLLAFIEALIFIAILVIALAYAWRKGALEWS